MAAIAFDTATAAIGREGERSRVLPGDEPATAPLQFQPLDPGIVSAAIPAFFIGRNKQGFWVARDAKGKFGGIFLLKDSALSFARRHSGRRDAQRSFRPSRSNSTWRTMVIRLSRILDR
jgi:hypothetical protein